MKIDVKIGRLNQVNQTGRFFLLPCLVLIWMISLTSPAVQAQATKTLNVLVPFAAGGTADITARQLSKDIGQSLNMNVIVDNRGGGGGTIATGLLARANPDGQTIMFHHMGITFDTALYDKLPFDTKTDIAPLAYLGATPNVLVVTNRLPVKNVKEFIEYARANPSKINYGSGGVGSAGHLAMETFQVPTNTKMTHIPYKGSGPAITDLVSGEIQAMLMTIAAIKPYIDNNQVKAFATSGLVRSAALPDLPTLHESGLKGFNYSPWYGVFVPAKTPAPIMNQLHDAINKALENPENKKKLSGQGLETKVMTRQEFEKIYQEDLDRWYKTITKLNIKG